MFERLNFTARRKLPSILQAENSECGLVCIAMISGYFGHRPEMTGFRRQCDLGQHGTNLSNLMRAAGQHHFACRAVRCEPQELHLFNQPVILHWDFNHFVVLKRCHRKYVVINDPAIGSHRISYDELTRHFTGVVLELTPDDNFKVQKTSIRLGFADFLNNLQGLVPVMGQIIVLASILQLIALITPFYTQLVVDEVLVKRDIDLLLVLGLGFAMVTIISVVTEAIRGWTAIYLTNQLSFQFGASLYQHLIHLPAAYFGKRHMGDIVSRFHSLEPIQDFITGSAIAILLDGLMAITTLTVVFIYSPLLGSLVIATILLDLLFQLVFFLPVKNRANEQLVASAQLDSNFMETVRNIGTIKRYGNEAERSSDWQNKFSDVINTDIRLGRLELSLSIIVSLITGLSGIAVIYIGALQVLRGDMSIGMLFAFIAYKNHLQNALASLSQEFITYLMLSLHFDRLADIKLEKAEVNDTIPHALSGSIDIKGLSFRYTKDSPWVIQDLNINIKARQLVAIYGPSGCGKSTLMALMQGCHNLTRGEICFDDKPLNAVGIRTLQMNCASVMQEDQLMAGSVRSNITFGAPVTDWQRLESVSKLAEVHEDISRLPMAYESLVGDMGNCLSAGQVQRVLIARALYHEPKILFLDEGTAHLDTLTAAKILRNIQQMKITCIFVTHLKSQLRFADKVILMDVDHHKVRRIRARQNKSAKTSQTRAP